MNWNKLTTEFKNLLHYSMFTGLMLFMIGAYELVSPGADLAIQLIIGLGFILMAVKDAKTRVWNKQPAASAWWSILGIAYPIAVSFKEKSMNSVIWYAVFSFFIPVIIGAAIVFVGEFVGLI